MTIWYKQGVIGQDRLHPKVQKAKGRIADLYAKNKEDLFITCIEGSTHSHGTFHEILRAIDFRYPKNNITKKEICNAAGPGFDLIFHKTHIHLEFDPK